MLSEKEIRYQVATRQGIYIFDNYQVIFNNLDEGEAILKVTHAKFYHVVLSLDNDRVTINKIYTDGLK